MALTLISTEDGYNVLEDENGAEVLVATTRPFPRIVVLWEDFDLVAAWEAATLIARQDSSWYVRPDRQTFVEDIRLAIADVDSIPDIVWCESCELPGNADDSFSVNGGHACQSCYDDHYSSCEDCGNTVHAEDTYYISDRTVCNRCQDNNYSFCEDCDEYYHHGDSEDHSHNGGCDCESPVQTFTMRNDGDPILNQDERVTIALPSGVISSEGIQQIAQLIQSHSYDVPLPQWSEDTQDAYAAAYAERDKWWSLARELETALGDKWQTKEGNYTKRLSKLAHKSHALKIPPAILSQVGCIARDNSTGVDFAIEMTRNLNLPASDFYHEESCWWQSYAESRCALKTNGGIGMRTFSGPYGEVQGRAWIMPLRLDENGALQPTFDSLSPDAFMVFNGYGDLSGYTPARIVAHMAGMTYRKVSFTASPMYVNNNSGYLVTSEEIADRHTDGSISLYLDTHSNLHHNETRSLSNVA